MRQLCHETKEQNVGTKLGITDAQSKKACTIA